MPRLKPTHYADFVRYDPAQGTLHVIDPRQAHDEPIVVASSEDAVGVLAAWSHVDAEVHAFTAAFVLALVAREWRGRPTDARRGALIQMAATLVGTHMAHAKLLLDDALGAANTALVAGDDPERAIITLVNERLRKVDRATNRCGRHGSGLLDKGDQVLTWGFGGLSLLALLSALPEPAPEVSLLAVAPPSNVLGANLLVRLANVRGIAGHVVESELAPTTFSTRSMVCVVGTVGVAMDGSAVCARGVGALVERARQHQLPCYLLAPNGPSPETPTADDLVAKLPPVDVVGANLVSSFVTDRGLYRPAMIARYLDEGETPLDVIPLLG